MRQSLPGVGQDRRRQLRATLQPADPAVAWTQMQHAPQGRHHRGRRAQARPRWLLLV